jgi:hypothetical protein
MNAREGTGEALSELAAALLAACGGLIQGFDTGGISNASARIVSDTTGGWHNRLYNQRALCRQRLGALQPSFPLLSTPRREFYQEPHCAHVGKCPEGNKDPLPSRIESEPEASPGGQLESGHRMHRQPPDGLE